MQLGRAAWDEGRIAITVSNPRMGKVLALWPCGLVFLVLFLFFFNCNLEIFRPHCLFNTMVKNDSWVVGYVFGSLSRFLALVHKYRFARALGNLLGPVLKIFSESIDPATIVNMFLCQTLMLFPGT